MINKPAGYNPMRWDCVTQGCYNLVKRPKIEVFADCFGGSMSFGDVDAILEVNSRALMLEWKPNTTSIRNGQDIMFRNLSGTNFVVVLVVAGDARSMEVTDSGLYVAGRFGGWAQSNLEHVKHICRRWYARALSLTPLKMREAKPSEQLTREAQKWVADYEAHEHDFDGFMAH